MLNKQSLLATLSILALTAGLELAMGRTWFGPDGQFGLWESSIWSSENSQRLADPYSFSHICHGIIFFGLLRWATPRLTFSQALVVAIGVEAGWELMENSPFIINRYREATISLGYVGDSVMNSLSDIGMMALGFWFASRVRWKISLAAVLIMEISCAILIRDNLTLNVLMLVHPVDSVRTWQSEVAPPHLDSH